MQPLARRSRSLLVTALLLALGAALALASATAPPAAAAGWQTAVGGDAGRTGLAAAGGPDDATLLWSGSRPAIVAQQGVADDGLLVVNRIQSFTIPTGTWIVAHELLTGVERWAVQLPFDAGHPSHRSKVTAIRDGQVYATRAGNTTEDYLYALDPADGSILWQSADKIGESSTESVSFAPNGDLVAGGFDALLRIDHTGGTTVWRVTRSCPSSDGCSPVVHGEHVYIWEASAAGPKVTVFDLATGVRLYSSAAIAGGLVQQVGLMVGPDGTVYAPRTQNNPATDFFVALDDTGTALVERWRVPMGYTPFASFGIGPDGTVYSYSRQLELLRLDPADGSVIDTSMPIPADFPAQPRLAIDQLGKVYLTNGGFAQGALFAFDADLTLRWSEPVQNVNLGGPVLAAPGVLVVCGIGNDVRAYRTEPAGVELAAAGAAPPGRLLLQPARPNPFAARSAIRFALPAPAAVSLAIYDAGGRRVRTLLDGAARAAGPQQVVWAGRDDRGRELPAGVYLYRLEAGGAARSGKLLRVR